MSQRRFRVGIMSFAHPHAGSYIMSLRERGDVELLAADPDSATAPAGELRGAALAEQLGVNYVATYDELLKSGLDAVIVCSENTRHRVGVELAAAAGAHVLCEKPLATEVTDAEAMIAACSSAGVKLMTAFPVRFSPPFKALQDIIDKGHLGQIVGATGTNNGKVPIGANSWFIDPELAGGGALIDLAVHVADLLDALLGGATPAKVYAATNDILHVEKPEVTTETGGLVNILYTGGVVATIDSSWSQPDSAPNWGGVTLQVVGTNGVVDIDTSALHVGGFDQDKGQSFWLDYGANTTGELIEEFLSSIEEDRQPQPSGEVGLRTLQVVKAAQASAVSGDSVEL